MASKPEKQNIQCHHSSPFFVYFFIVDVLLREFSSLIPSATNVVMEKAIMP